MKTGVDYSTFVTVDNQAPKAVEAMKKAIGVLNPRLSGFDASCFDGVYVTGDVSPEQIQQLNEGRAQQAQEGEEDTSRLALPNASEH